MTGSDPCAVRLALERQLADAVRRVYVLLGQLDAMKRGRSVPELRDRLYADLAVARVDERRAEDQYREHVERHGCIQERAVQAHARL